MSAAAVRKPVDPANDPSTPEGRIAAWVSAARRHGTQQRWEYRLAWYLRQLPGRRWQALTGRREP